MADKWTDRTVRGPVEEFFTAEQFANLFNLSADTILRMVQDGVIPPPARYGRQAKMFTWEHVTLFYLRCKLTPDPPAKVGKKTDEDEE